MKKRDIAVCILLSIVTCGIYGLVWFIGMTDDAVKANRGQEYNTSGGMAFLLVMLTCGIYGIYWYYKMGKALYVANIQRGRNASDNSTLYLLLGIFGLGLVSECLIQSELNALCD